MSLEFIESADLWHQVYQLLPDFPGKIYYSHAYYSACAANGDGRPVAILFVPDGLNNDDAATMLQQGRALFYPFLMRAVPGSVGGHGCFDSETAYGYGGPATFNMSAAELLEFDRCFKEWALARNIVAEFIRFNPLDVRQQHLNRIYQPELNRITVSIRLDSGFSDILNNCTPAKRRNWRRAEREGLHLLEMPDLKAFRSLYGSTMNRLGAQPFYHFSPAYFAALENLPQKNRFFAAVFTAEQKLAAAAVFLLDADSAHYHLGASDPAFRESQANVFMILEFARQQATTGRKTLHLGGGLSLQPDDRLYRFKAGLTTCRHDFFIGRRIHQPELYKQLSQRWQALTGKKPDILLHYHYGVEMPTFDQKWNEIHETRNWGKYPAEELVRYMSRNFPAETREQMLVLDLGCGTGANTWFLCREGFNTVAFDGAFAALPKARALCAGERRQPLLTQADAGNLPFADCSFDAIVEIGALASNNSKGLDRILAEISRTLKPGGRFFSSVLFSQSTTGYGTGEKIDEHSYRNVVDSPVSGLGTIHFFTEREIETLWKRHGFENLSIDHCERTDHNRAYKISFHVVGCQRRK